MKYLIYITLIFAFACSPVRKDYQSRKLNDEKTKKVDEAEYYSEQAKARTVSDTVTKILPQIFVEINDKNTNQISKDLDAAVYKFNDGLYEESCNDFKVLKETLKEYDSLYYETIFYSSECLIVNKEYTLAEEMLKNLLSNENLNGSVKERTLLRLGHINCAFEDDDNAKYYFNMLKEVNPKSQLLPLANCESLN